MAIRPVLLAPDRVPVRRALISLSDKSGLDTLVRDLVRLCPGIVLYSTGGTYNALRGLLGGTADATLVQVSEYTGQPETDGGLVKTLDYKIYLSLLTEAGNPLHDADLARTGAVPFDLVVVNLYPFAAAAKDGNAEHARGHIDIGGPTMLRAAAKNYLRVAVASDPGDYPDLIAALAETAGATTLPLRFSLARRTFARTAAYDAAISAYLTALDPARVAGLYTEPA